MNYSEVKKVFISVVSLLCFVCLSSQANTRIKTVEYSFGSYYGTSEYSSRSGPWEPAEITVYFPEAPVTIRNAFLEFEAIGVNALDVGEFDVYFNQGTSATNQVFLSNNANTYNTGEQVKIYGRFDVTSRIDGSLTSASYSAGVGVNNTDQCAMSLKLYVTYEYDDTSASRIKTVRFPIYSDWTNKIAAKTSEAGEGSHGFDYLCDIEDLQTERNQWFEITGLNQNQEGKANKDAANITTQISGGNESQNMYIDQGEMAGSGFKFIDHQGAGTSSGFSANTQQTINVNLSKEWHQWGTLRTEMLGGECFLTYEFNESASTKTKTAAYFLGQDTDGGAASFTKTIHLQENVLQIKEVYAKIYGSYSSASGADIAVDSSISGNSLSQTSYYVNAISPHVSGFNLIHSLTSGKDYWNVNTGTGTQVSLSIGNLSGLGSCAAELVITYDYTDEKAYTDYYNTFAGQSPDGISSGYDLNYNLWFPQPGGGTSTLRTAWLKSSFVQGPDNSGESVTTADPSTTLNLNSSGDSQSVFHRTQNETWGQNVLYENQNQIVLNSTWATGNYQISVNKAQFSASCQAVYDYIPSPYAPYSLSQYESDGATGIPQGGWIKDNDVIIVLKSSSPLSSDSISSRIELRPAEQSFTGVFTSSLSAVDFTGVPITSTFTLTDLTPNTTYHWQARVRGRGEYSLWQYFPEGGSDADFDFGIDQSSPSVIDNQAGLDDWQTEQGAVYDVDFEDFLSLLDNVQYTVYRDGYQAGEQIIPWTDIAAGINASQYLSDWTVDFNSLKQGINYVSVRAYDNVGNYSVDDVFYIKKDTTSPGIINNMSGGDDSWRKTDPGAIYDIDFEDNIALLDTAQYAVYAQPSMGGENIIGWTDIFSSTDVALYEKDFAVDFNVLESSYNYVSVRCWDTAGTTTTMTDAFYIKKDTVVPAAVNNESGGDDTWRKQNSGVYDIDFYDSGASNLKDAQYKIVSSTGGVFVDWYTYAPSINSDSYEADFSIENSHFSLLKTSYSYVSVRAYDHCGNTVTLTDAFYIKKDTAAPTYQNNESGGDSTWLRTQRSYDVNFYDGISGLGGAEYKAEADAQEVISYTSIPGVSGDSFTDDWNVNFDSLKHGATNYISLKIYDLAGNTATVSNAFYIKKDTTPPSIDNEQSGDDNWRSKNSGYYNVNFTDEGNSLLDKFQIKVTTGSEYTGTLISDWVDVETNISSSSYTEDWQISDTVFDNMHKGKNYVHVKVFDVAGSSQALANAFYVKKDTIAPAFTNNEQGGDATWRNKARNYDVDFYDYDSSLSGASYWAEVDEQEVISLTPISGVSGQEHTQDWSVEFDSLKQDATNQISIEIYDTAGNTTTVSNAFFILKDTSPPQIINNESGGDDTWRKENSGVYDIDYIDSGGSKLKDLQYRITDSEGGEVVEWYTYASSIGSESYSADFSISDTQFDLLISSISYVSVQGFDVAGNTRTLSNAFHILKDTQNPVVIINQDSYGPYSGDPGEVIDVDFEDLLSKLDYARYTIYDSQSMGGENLKKWTNIYTSTNVSKYEKNWDIDFGAVLNQPATNWFSVKVYDNAGNMYISTDAFKMFKSTPTPKITNNQPDVDIWITAPGETYDVDFSSNSEYALDRFLTRLCSEPKGGGAVYEDWSVIKDNIGAPEYNDDWQIHFSSAGEGINYVSVWAYDEAGHNTRLSDVFYIKKDTSPPVIDNNEQGGDNVWRKINDGFYGVYFTDHEKGSYLDNAQYKINSSTGGLLVDWYTFKNFSSTHSFSSDWQIEDSHFDLLGCATNYVSVRVQNEAGMSDTINDAFYILKDTVAPQITSNVSGDDTWRVSSGTVYDVDFFDPCGKLYSAQYRITSSTGATVVDWYSFAFPIDSDTYEDFSLTGEHFNMIKTSTSYVSLRAYDYAGNYSYIDNAFYIKKDTSPPVIVNSEQGGDSDWINAGRSYDVDFKDDVSKIKKAQYAVYKATDMKSGEEVISWTDIVSSTNTENYTLDWNVDFNSLAQGVTNYVSVRSFNWANSTTTLIDAFYILKDTTPPGINDLQDGDTYWRKTNSAFYNVDFNDSGGSRLKNLKARVYGKPGEGEFIADWSVQISSMDTNSYTRDWQISTDTWHSLINGQNYISLRVFDYAGNSTETVDAFYILKDTAFPVVSNYEVDGDTNWVNSSQYYNVDFSDEGSWMEGARYRVYSSSDSKGGLVLDWQDIFTSTTTQYNQDWEVIFSSLTQGVNYVTVQAFDHVGNTSTIVDAFFIKKDTCIPEIVNNQTGDDQWRRINNGGYDIDFYDTGGSSISFVQTRASTDSVGGNYIYDWENELVDIGSSSYTQDWSLNETHWNSLVQGVTNYISVKVLDLAGNTSSWANAFYVLKDTSPPLISDLQDGDTTWRNVNDGLYDVNYTDSGGSGLSRADYKITNPLGGTIVDWYTYAADIDSDSYSSDLSIENAHFDLITSSLSYVSVKTLDKAGSTSTLVNAFYIKKDTTPPVIYNNQSGDLSWRNANTGVYDVDFEDTLSLVKCVEYKIKDNLGGTLVEWTSPDGLSNISTDSYTANWQIKDIDFDSLPPNSTSYVDVRCFDHAGSTDLVEGAFFIKKDTIAPGAVTDLAGSSGSEGEVVLNWTVTGDDADSGFLDNGLYRIIYTDDHAALWDDSNNFTKDISTSVSSGANQNYTLTGLVASSTYYFWVRLKDKATNWSEISNSTSCPAGPDITPPAKVTDLTALTGDFQGQIKLFWTSPGDNNNTGTAEGYEIKYATYIISSANYDSVTDIVSNPPSPLSAGNLQECIVQNLQSDLTYWFALKAYDEADNYSFMSSTSSTMPAPQGERDGMLVFGEGSLNYHKTRIWSGGSWSDGVSGETSNSTIRWAVVKSNNILRDEKMAGILSSDNTLYIQRYDGLTDTWSSSEGFSAATGISAYRCFDIAYEQNSARCMVAYYKNTPGQISYRVWSSTSQTWAAAETNLDILAGDIQWVELEPRPGTDEIMLVAMDSNSNIYAYRWNGSSFVNGNSINTNSATYNQYQCFDIAWESQSGNCMVVWGEAAIPKSTIFHKIWDGSSWGTADEIIRAQDFKADTSWLRAASDPTSDRIGITVIDDQSDWNARVWDGTQWGTLPSEDSSISGYTTAVTDCAWEKDSGKFIVVASDSSDRIDWAYWQNGTWYNAEGELGDDLNNATQESYDFGLNIKWIRLSPDPNVNKMILTCIEDGDSIRTLNWTGSEWSMGTLQSSNASDFNYECSYLTQDRHDNTPPVLSDAQSGYDVWQSTNYGRYNVDFSDTGGSKLSRFQSKITDTSDELVEDWTTVKSGINTNDYNQDWKLLDTTFDAMKQGTNKVYIRVYDGVGNVDYTEGTYCFYVKKDTAPPVITDNQQGDYTWRNSDGVSYDIDLSDQYSGLDDMEYAVYSKENTQGTQVIGWSPVFTNLNQSEYTDDWQVDFYSLDPGTGNWISVRAWDVAGSSVVSKDVFVVYKDTIAPSDITDLTGLTGETYGQIKLSWTSPGDNKESGDNSTGQYLLKYSTSGPITDDTEFNSAQEYSQSWTPVSAGAKEEHILLNLNPDLTYWFAVKTRDKVNDRGSHNWSGLSNCASNIRPQPGNLFVNEVYSRGSSGEDWIELYNFTESEIDLSGWRVDYYNGSSTSTIESWASGSISSHTFMSIDSLSLDHTVSGKVMLYNDSGIMVSYIKYPVLSTSGSISRIYDGGIYIIDDLTPTKGFKNSISTHPVKINEVNYDTDEFIEIYNTSSSTMVLSGYKITNKNRQEFDFTREVYPKSFSGIVHTSVDTDQQTYTDCFGAEGMDSDSDYVCLENSRGQVIDFVSWQGSEKIHYDKNARLVNYIDGAPSGASVSIGRNPSEGSDTDSDSYDFKEFSSASLGTGNNQTSPYTNTVNYPGDSYVLPRNFKIEMSFGEDSSGGTSDTVWFIRTSGSQDNKSPHIYRLTDIGFDLSDTSVQASTITGISQSDIDGYTLSTGTVYTMLVNSDSSEKWAKQIKIEKLTYDTTIHSIEVSSVTPSFCKTNEMERTGISRIDINNQSASGYNAIEFESVGVIIDDGSVPLTTVEAQNIFDEIFVVFNSTDCSSNPEFQPNRDLYIGSVSSSSFSLDSGKQIISITDPDSLPTTISPGQKKVYFVGVKPSSGSASNSFRISIDDENMNLREAESDVVQDIADIQTHTSSEIEIIEQVKSDWTEVSVDSAPVYAAPCPQTFNEQNVFMGSDDGKLRALDSSGTVKWTFDAQDKIRTDISGSQASDSDPFYMYFGDEAGNIYKLRDDGESYTKMWSHSPPGKVDNIIEWRGYVYATGADGSMHKLDTETGIGVSDWDGTLSGALQGSPIIKDGWREVYALWVASDNGEVYRLQLSDGLVTSSLDSGSKIVSPPHLDSGYYDEEKETNFIFAAAENGKIYCRTSSNLTTIPDGWKGRQGHNDGEFPTSYPIKGGIWKNNEAGNSYLYFGNEGGYLYKIDVDSGTLTWSQPYKAEGAVNTKPVVLGGYVYFGDSKGYYYALDITDGAAMKQGYPIYLGSAVTSNPSYDSVNKRLFIGTQDGRIHAIKIE